MTERMRSLETENEELREAYENLRNEPQQPYRFVRLAAIAVEYDQELGLEGVLHPEDRPPARGPSQESEEIPIGSQSSASQDAIRTGSQGSKNEAPVRLHSFASQNGKQKDRDVWCRAAVGTRAAGTGRSEGACTEETARDRYINKRYPARHG